MPIPIHRAVVPLRLTLLAISPLSAVVISTFRRGDINISSGFLTKWEYQPWW